MITSILLNFLIHIHMNHVAYFKIHVAEDSMKWKKLSGITASLNSLSKIKLFILCLLNLHFINKKTNLLDILFIRRL